MNSEEPHRSAAQGTERELSDKPQPLTRQARRIG